jgi:hypothetical protein
MTKIKFKRTGPSDCGLAGRWPAWEPCFQMEKMARAHLRAADREAVSCLWISDQRPGGFIKLLPW